MPKPIRACEFSIPNICAFYLELQTPNSAQPYVHGTLNFRLKRAAKYQELPPRLHEGHLGELRGQQERWYTMASAKWGPSYREACPQLEIGRGS